MRTPIVLQTEASECGLACLAMAASFHGRVTDLAALRRRWSVSMKGLTLAHLIAMAQDLKLAARALRADLADLGDLRLPAVLHWDLNHFVILERVARRHAWVIDPAVGRRRIPLVELSAHYTGIALELTPADGFERRRDRSPLPLRAFFRGTTGLGVALTRVFLLSVALQLFALALPFFSQIVVDEIVVTGDRALLTVLGASFLLVVIVHTCLSAVRGWVTISLAATLQFGWAARLFAHLVRLPLDYFEKRHVGDVVSRFGSIRAVERVVAGSMVEAVMDGLMALATLGLMLAYSPRLTLVTVLAVGAYAVTRAVLLPRARAIDHEALAAQAREASVFMESLRAIMPLKAYAKESVRESVWQGDRARAVSTEVRANRLRLLQQVINGGLFAAENIVVLWVGATIVMDGALTLGMLVAFVAYKSQFATKAASLIDRVVEFGLLRVHLDRIADIALVQTLDRNLGIVYWIIALLSIAGYCLSFATSVWANVDRKRREFSVLRLTGFRTRDIVWFPILQAAFTAVLAWVLASLVFFAVQGMLNGLFAASIGGGEPVCRLRAWHLGVALGLTLVAAIIAAASSRARSAVPYGALSLWVN